MANKNLDLAKKALGLALCFMLVDVGTIAPLHAENAGVTVNQQTMKVKGSVKDVNGESLLGVNVVMKGTTNGTITDLDGNYSLDVPAGATIVFSYIGFESKSIKATGGTLNVVLKEDSQNLEEVVVVGYGTQQKKDITGSVAVVDSKDLLKSTGASATQQLQGKAAGVYIGQTGSPGSPTTVRIRGINSVNDNGPLYVIDGVSTRNQDMSSLNPNDIESMQVLKDASSAAIYGAQAANGVILITTKKGSRGDKPTVSYNGYVGVQTTHDNQDLMNSADRLTSEWESQANNIQLNNGTSQPSSPQFGNGGDHFIIPNYMTTTGAKGAQDISLDDYSFPKNIRAPFSDTDWWDEVDHAALIQNHQLSLSGGTQKGQYNFSANYFDQEGTVVKSYYKRYQIRANTSFNVRDWLRFGENLTYSFTKDNGLNSGSAEDNPYSWVYRMSPYIPVTDVQGNWAGTALAGLGNGQNIVGNQYRNEDNYYTHNRVFGNMYAEADLMKGLTFRTNFGLDYTNYYNYSMNKLKLERSEASANNDFTENSGFNYRYVWTNTLNFSRTFNEVHNLKVLLGTEAIRDGLGRGMTGQRYDYLFEDNTDTWVLGMGANDNRRVCDSWYNGEFALFGMFARLDYNYANKYLFTGIVRRDGVSRFSENNRYGVFPSFSFGWRVSEEGFMENTRDWLDDLKLRVGYGTTGNSEMSRKTNYAYEFSTSSGTTNYDLSGANTGADVGYQLSKYGNPDTKWETNRMVNIGLDATILNGKFGVGLEWYYKKTSDMLLEAAYSAIAGPADKPYLNYGSMKNTGVDANFNYRDRKGDFNWEIALNLSTYKNEVLELSENEDFAMWGDGTRLDGSVTRTTAGHPISEFYGYNVVGFYDTADEVKSVIPYGADADVVEANPEKYLGKFKYEDLNGDGKITGDDRKVLGSPHPDLIAGLNMNLGYKNWDFTMFWYSTIGNDLFNNTKIFTDFNKFTGGNRSNRVRDYSWEFGADNSDAILPINDSGDNKLPPNSYYVENASFLKLKNVVLGYTFPKAWLQKATISNLRVYLQAENLLTITGYDGMDPEMTNPQSSDENGADLTRGVDMGGWPTTMKLLFGVNFTF